MIGVQVQESNGYTPPREKGEGSLGGLSPGSLKWSFHGRRIKTDVSLRGTDVLVVAVAAMFALTLVVVVLLLVGPSG